MAKIAVCMFGHVGGKKGRDGFGGWNDPVVSHQNYMNMLFVEHDVDFFVHSWAEEYKREIIEAYEPRKYEIVEQKDFSHHTLDAYTLKHLDSYRDLFLAYGEDAVPKHVIPLIFRSHSRWYSTKRSVELMSEYAVEMNLEYDWVVQLRFDLIFNRPFPFEFLEKNVFYCPKRAKKDGAVDDLWFLSNQSHAETFAKLYDNIFNYSIRPPFAAQQHLHHMNLEYKSILEKGSDYDLLRKSYSQKNTSHKTKLKRKIREASLKSQKILCKCLKCH